MSTPSSVSGPDLSQRGIFRFWVPLASTWVMMAWEGPFLAAVIARLADPKIGLASYGVAIAFALVVESPVLMLMSAANALIEDATGYRRLRTFAAALNAFGTGLLLVILIPPVHATIFSELLKLPDPVVRQTYGALWLFLPWPAAIGIRRFLQGVMIRAGRTRLVAYGTTVRLTAMASGAILYGPVLRLPGAWVGAAALSTGVMFEALAARLMARESIREILRVRQGPGDGRQHLLGYREILSFYYPLALTSLLGLAVGPMVTFFMGRSVSPVESLAVFPVVYSLLFFFRALGLSFQDAAIALLGRGRTGYAEVSRFAIRMGISITALLAVIAFTPLASVWFHHVVGLSTELTAFAIPAAKIMVPLPLLGVWLSLERGVLMRNRRTRPITWATASEVVTIAALFAALAWGVGMVGVTAAFIALLFGRTASTAYLIPATRQVLRGG